MSAARLLSSRRIRATPYHRMVVEHGVSDYTVVNHTLLPKGFGRSVEDDYWHLREHVQLWDVGCQRQVEIVGKDAVKLVQWMTPRDIRRFQVGQCRYAPLVDRSGSMINDPIVLKLAENRFWLSIADSDVLLWARGLAEGAGLDVSVFEPDVWPMAVQGPKADDLMAGIFGDDVRDLGFFRFAWLPFSGHPLLVARSGFSAQGGFELYLDRPALAESLWTSLWNAGQGLNVSPGSPNLIERIEAGLLSYGNDINRDNNPMECGMEKYCRLDGAVDFLGLKALQAVKAAGAKRQISGVRFGDTPCGGCSRAWKVSCDGQLAGEVTSAAWSPGFEQNVAIAMMESAFAVPGMAVVVDSEHGKSYDGATVRLPMKPPIRSPGARPG